MPPKSGISSMKFSSTRAMLAGGTCPTRSVLDDHVGGSHAAVEYPNLGISIGCPLVLLSGLSQPKRQDVFSALARSKVTCPSRHSYLQQRGPNPVPSLLNERNRPWLLKFLPPASNCDPGTYSRKASKPSRSNFTLPLRHLHRFACGIRSDCSPTGKPYRGMKRRVASSAITSVLHNSRA